MSGTNTRTTIRKQVTREENSSENLSRELKSLKTGWNRPDKRNDRIRIEKKGQSSWPSSRKDNRKRRRKYLNTIGLNVFADLVAGLLSISVILAA
jgi:hypothetical protein